MIETVLLAAALSMTPREMPATPPPVAVAKSDPNQTGRQPSAYRGEFYDPTMEPYRQCVAQREGRHQYWVTGSNGLYESTYQMTDALVAGAAWMMAPELRDTFGDEEGKRIRDELLETPGRKWNRFYMDMAFWTVVNWEGRASGAGHWRGGRFSCHPDMDDWGGSR